MKKFFLFMAACGAAVFGTGCSDDDPVPVKEVVLNQTELSLEPGQTVRLSVAVSPSDAAYDGVVWTTSDASVATVEDGTVAAVAVGEATITASAGDRQATCVVRVAVAARGISLDRDEASVPVGGELQLTATVEPENATDRSVVWSSSDESVATVSQTGAVQGVAVGTATITVSTGEELSATCTVSVVEAAKTWAVGDLYDVDGVKGVVVSIENGGINGKIVSMDEAVKLWATGGWNIGCTSETDGKANTQKVKDYNADMSQFPAFKWCVDHGAGWYMPACDEVYAFMRNSTAINATLAANGGTKITDYYWTSTESDSSEGTEALYAYFSGGGKVSSYADFKDAPEDDTYVRAMYAF